jgi:hypothetical protein
MLYQVGSHLLATSRTLYPTLPPLLWPIRKSTTPPQLIANYIFHSVPIDKQSYLLPPRKSSYHPDVAHPLPSSPL